jgi:hypothetical protein
MSHNRRDSVNTQVTKRKLPMKINSSLLSHMLGVAALLGAASFLPLSAATLGFNQNQFTVTVPDDWTTQQADGNQVSAQNDDGESLAMFTGPVDDVGPLTGDSPYVHNLVATLQHDGIKIGGGQTVTINGAPYYVLFLSKARTDGVVNSTVFLTVASGQIYQVTFGEVNGDPNTNIDYRAIINSFSVKS